MTAKKEQNELAYEKLKEGIVTLQLVPGEFLNIARLMSQFKVGRTPVNHAIHRLQDEKLVQIIPRKGVVVSPLSLDEALDLIAVRTVNEKLCIALAAQNITGAQLDHLEYAQTQYRKAVEMGNMVKALEADRIFHEGLAEASGNRVLPDVMKRLHARAQRFWALSLNNEQHSLEVFTEHEAILSALKARNVDAAIDAIEEHITSFHRTFFDTISSRLRRA